MAVLRYIKESTMTTNSVKSVYFYRGKIYIDYFDAEGKKRARSTGLKATETNKKRAWKELVPTLEARWKEEAIKKVKKDHPLDYYSTKYIDRLKAQKHTKLDAHSGRVKYILNFLGEKTKPRDITEQDIEDLYNSLDIKRTTKMDWLVVMRGILNHAKKDRAVSENVAVNFKAPESTEADMDGDSAVEPFEPDEVKKLLENSDGIMNNFLGVAFNQGLRPEETIALMMQDVDFENNIIHIKNVITKKVMKPVTRKKGGARDIPMFNATRQYLLQQIEYAKSKKSLFLFCNEDGNRLNDVKDIRGRKGRKNTWHELLRKNGIRHRALKNTRHTFAVQSIKSKAFSLQEVAAMMGHTSLRMLLQIYAKWLGQSHIRIDRSVDIFEVPTSNLTSIG